ncbi:MAG: nucleotide kinase [Nitrospira bacterium HGW-Nitrospira-1]|nr:MAG: nucleotide kinase [Nitrospira bacterium HGW-Nitrospira-1]
MNNILITGLPGAGKTTLMKKLCLIFKEFNPAGFFTSEILENGERVGFAVENLNGDRRILAHINLKSRCSIGKFKVDVKGFEDFMQNIMLKEKKTGLYIFDEICRMECKSKKFSKLLADLLNSDKPLIATIPDKGAPLLNEIRKRDDVRIFELTSSSHEHKLKELTMVIRDLLLE